MTLSAQLRDKIAHDDSKKSPPQDTEASAVRSATGNELITEESCLCMCLFCIASLPCLFLEHLLGRIQFPGPLRKTDYSGKKDFIFRHKQGSLERMHEK